MWKICAPLCVTQSGLQLDKVDLCTNIDTKSAGRSVEYDMTNPGPTHGRFAYPDEWRRVGYRFTRLFCARTYKQKNYYTSLASKSVGCDMTKKSLVTTCWRSVYPDEWHRVIYGLTRLFCAWTWVQKQLNTSLASRSVECDKSKIFTCTYIWNIYRTQQMKQSGLQLHKIDLCTNIHTQKSQQPHLRVGRSIECDVTKEFPTLTTETYMPPRERNKKVYNFTLQIFACSHIHKIPCISIKDKRFKFLLFLHHASYICLPFVANFRNYGWVNMALGEGAFGTVTIV